MLNFASTGLFESKAQTLVNTVNTVGVMGKGIAAVFKKQYPGLFQQYKAHCDTGEFDPGTSWLWKGDDRWVLNFATKKNWRHPSKLSYIRSGLEEFRNNYELWGIREISFPKLGCGNGGLNWNEVRGLMVDYLSGLPIAVYVHDFDKETLIPEHEDDLFEHKRAPKKFGKFLEDIIDVVERSNGELNAIRIPAKCKIEVSKSPECDEEFAMRICSDGQSEASIICEDDLFQFWLKMLNGYASRSDLPELAWDNALALFSIIEKLPYTRILRIRNGKDHFSLAAEMILSPHDDRAIEINPI